MQNPLCPGPSRCSRRGQAAGWLLRSALLLLVLPLVGCSGKGGAKDSVSGTVKLGDKPVAGSVNFVYSDGKVLDAPISPEGEYMIVNPPPGQVKIVIKPLPGSSGTGGLVGDPKAKDLAMPKDAADPGGAGAPKGPPPPLKYQSAASTDLTYEVQKGKQTKNIELTP